MITAVVTKKGRILQNKQVNGADLKFTRAVASTASTPVEELKEKTSITSIVQTLSIQSITQNEREQSYTILVLLENANLTKSYNLNQIGFYAKDPDDGEILFAIAQFDTPKKIETPSVEPGYTLEMPFTFQNSNDANVKIDFDPDNLMSRAGVEAMLNSEEISRKANGNVIAVSDSAESPFLDFKLFGKSEQVTTTGKNFFDISKEELIVVGNSGTERYGYSFDLTGTYTFSCTGNRETSITCKVVSDGVYGDYKSFVLSANYTVTLGEKDVLIIYRAEENVRLSEGIENAQLEVGTVATEYEPYTGCKAAPSPDYPQEVESTGDDGSVALNVQGKNLWTVDNTNDNLTYDPATQIMTINGPVNLTVHELPVPIPKGTRITISAEVVGGVVTSNGDGGLAFGGYYKPEKGTATWQGYINVPKCSVQDLTGQKYSNTFETTEEVTHFYAFVYAATASVHEPLKVKVQYEINNIATDFELHKASQLANILTPNGLHGIPVSEGGNYTDENGQEWICDEINLAKRKYIQRVKSETLDGTNLVPYHGTHANDQVYCAVYPKDIMPSSPVISDLYKAESWSNWNNSVYCIGGSIIFTDSRFTDEDAAKNLWADELPKVLYALATPIETDLTDEQIAAFESLTAHENTTTILMDGIGDMEVQYFKDTENGKAMGILKSEHIYLKKLIGDVNAVVQGLVG